MAGSTRKFEYKLRHASDVVRNYSRAFYNRRLRVVGWESFIVYLSAALPTFIIGIFVGRNSKSKEHTPSASHNKQSTPCECDYCVNEAAIKVCESCFDNWYR